MERVKPTPAKLTQLITVKELASQLAMSVKAVRMLLYNGKIPEAAVVQFDRSVRFDVAAIQTWLDSKRMRLAGP